MAATFPGWVGPTAAISLVIIALAFAVIATAMVLVARVASTEIRQLSEELGRLRQELAPALQAMKRIAEAGAELSGDVRQEIQQYLVTSRAVRKDLERGVRRVKIRLADLDALYEVVHDEVEDTALDVAAGVRSVRRGAGMVGRLRRWLVRGRR
jgi:uncharacterized protein YoxC